MPGTLKFIAHSFNDISESGTFDKRMASFSFGNIRIVQLEREEHVNGLVVYCHILLLKKVVSSSGGYRIQMIVRM
jgi:hypothetical protein